ncbi:MAG: MvdD family ATP-grasp ribosomal peptide maturase [Phycisphaerae bacterium]|nr:MvdD family ATP-grasp ribosomal peptide maturase [Phycisphaerae bacterium]
MSVLILTRSDDNESVDMVTRALVARGERVVRLDSDRFPTEVRLALVDGAHGASVTMIDGDAAHDLREVRSIWLRRHHVAGLLPSDMDAQLRAGAVAESRAALFGLLGTLNAFWMDPLPVIRWAGQKPIQLRVARELGLAVPRTLVTNDPERVREFSRSCPQGIVAKMLASFRVLDDGIEKVVFTSPVSEEHLDRLDDLRWSPMTFQERVPKQLELRVTIVGPRLFAASIDSQAFERAREDWRRDGLAMLDAWKRFTLPADLERRLLELMKRLDLNYGAADFVVTPDGQVVFLEINPSGEFFWLERCPGLPISDAIADVLTGRAAGGARADP